MIRTYHVLVDTLVEGTAIDGDVYTVRAETIGDAAQAAFDLARAAGAPTGATFAVASYTALRA